MAIIKNIQIGERDTVCCLIASIVKNPYKYSLNAILKFLSLVLKNEFEEKVVLKNIPSFNFKNSEVEFVDFQDQKFLIHTNRLGIAHADNNLPNTYIEDFVLCDGNAANKNKASEEFLNIFNNRILHISFKISKTFELGLSACEFEDTYYGKFILAMCGNVQKSNNALYRVSVEALWHNNISIEDLLAFIRGFIDNELEIFSQIGGLEKVDDDFISLNEKNNVLNINAFLGMYIWNANRYVDIVIYEDYENMLWLIRNKIPGLMRSLDEYLHFIIKYRMFLRITKTSIVPENLSSRNVFLGINSWLISNNFNYYNIMPITEVMLESIFKI